MPAFYVADVTWTDEAARQKYVAAVGETVTAFGGKLFAGSAENLEGDWRPQRLAVLEFESAEQFRKWYDSPEYADLKALRLGGSDSKAVLISA